MGAWWRTNKDRADATEIVPIGSLFASQPLRMRALKTMSAIRQRFTDTIPPQNTTNTADWITLSSGVITIPQRDVILDVLAQALVSHSANAATVGLRVVVYEADGTTAVVLTQQDPVYLATLGQNYPLTVVQNILATKVFAQAIPGQHTVKLQMRNHTAGTLTVVTGGTFAEAFVEVQATHVSAASAVSAIATPVAIGTSTVQDAVALDQSPHIFTTADGNRVVVYWNGTNIGYRIKSAGGWGTFTNLAGTPANGQVSVFTRNGDTIYGMYGNNGATANIAVKLAYAGGAIVMTSANQQAVAGLSQNVPIGAFWDSTNSFIHFWYMAGSAAALDAFDANLGAKYTAAANLSPASGITALNVAGIAGSAATFYLCLGSLVSTTVSVTQVVAGALAYTQTNETGVPALAANGAGMAMVYDGTNFILFANENNAVLRYSTRTAANTYAAWSTIVTATLAAFAPAPWVRLATPRDIALFYRSNTGQANGEVFYIRRIAGTWDASPGRVFAGGDTSGYSNPSCAADDLNAAGMARVVYLVGTANPFTLNESALTL